LWEKNDAKGFWAKVIAEIRLSDYTFDKNTTHPGIIFPTLFGSPFFPHNKRHWSKDRKSRLGAMKEEPLQTTARFLD
jgi:hypothetical protein